MLKCTRNGCGKEYDPKINPENSCQFHQGQALFHEGLKGWNCCEKKVINFQDFLSIPGCCFGSHTQELINKDIANPINSMVNKVNKEEIPFHSNNNQEPLNLSQNVSLKLDPIQVIKEDSKIIQEIKEEEKDEPNCIVSEGTYCKRQGCQYQFTTNELSKPPGIESICKYHPGIPIFHEGSKGWSCCKKKVLEFDLFMKIEGCKETNHLFIGNLKNGREFLDCKIDWYQTPSQIVISLFAKKVDTTKSKIKIHSNEIEVDLQIGENQYYNKNINLFSNINNESSSFKFFSTKVEIVIDKLDGIAWPSLEPTDNITSWTTFGKGDSPLPNVVSWSIKKP